MVMRFGTLKASTNGSQMEPECMVKESKENGIILVYLLPKSSSNVTSLT